jgi:hypothetical protein
LEGELGKEQLASPRAPSFEQHGVKGRCSAVENPGSFLGETRRPYRYDRAQHGRDTGSYGRDIGIEGAGETIGALSEGLVTVALKAEQSSIQLQQWTRRVVTFRKMCRTIDALLPRIAHEGS